MTFECISRLSGPVRLALRYTTADIHCRDRRYEWDGGIIQVITVNCLSITIGQYVSYDCDCIRCTYCSNLIQTRLRAGSRHLLSGSPSLGRVLRHAGPLYQDSTWPTEFLCCSYRVLNSLLTEGRIYLGPISHSDQLNLAVHPWIGANKYWWWSFGHYQGRNGQFCMTVGPVTRTCLLYTSPSPRD